MNTPRHAFRAPQRLHPLAQALAAAWALGLALAPTQARPQALPSGLQVVQGQATVATQGSRMTVTTSAGAALNWQSFSIGSGQAVHFAQPSATSQVLNRVLGRDPSQINGSLSSNGIVWLLNPYGVLFGREARVDVAGLVASTLAISDADWRAQRFSLTGGEQAAGLSNLGEIRTTTGGQVLLLGGAGGVRNEGVIDAPGGQVALAAGASVDLSDSRTPQVAVRVSAPAGQVLNLGSLAAAGGRIDLQAAMVNQQGLVRADGLGQGPSGEIVLTASRTAELAPGSHTTADGSAGGRVQVQGGTTLVSGVVSASGRDAAGGGVRLLGDQVGLLAGADVRADGARGGGEVLVGGGLQGKDASVPNARATYMDGLARVSADATVQGSGGRVVLWGNEATRAYGSLSARGGAAGGDGGLIETSGGWLDARPRSVQADAPAGRAGQWLLDPNNLLIVSSGGDSGITGSPNFTTTTDSAVITTNTIALALDAGNNVTVTTGTGTPDAQAGDITMSGATLLVAPSSAVTFSLVAHRHIDISGSTILSNGAPLSVLMSAGNAGVGAIQVGASQIATAGGSITLSGPSTACGPAGCAPFAGAVAATGSGRSHGIDISSSTLSAGNGTITMRGASTVDDQSAGGVRLGAGSSIGAARIDIAGWVGAGALHDQMGLYSAAHLTAGVSMALEGINRIAGSGGTSRTLAGVMLDPSGQVMLSPSAAGGSPQVKVRGQSDQLSGNSSYSLYFGATGLVAGTAPVELSADGAPALIQTSSSLNLSDGGPFTISGSSAFSVRSDINLPAGQPVVIRPQGGLTLEGLASGLPSSLTVDTGSAALTITAFSGSAGFSVGSAPVTLRAGTLDMQGFSGSASVDGGTILVRAGTVKLGFNSSLSASGTGDALVIAGSSGNVATFDATGGSLFVPNGRWMVWATDPTDSANFNAGSLVHDFRQYDARYGQTAPLGSGNGLLFSLAATASPSGSIAAKPVKVYDGTTAVTLGTTGLQLQLQVPGDVATGTVALGAANFADPNAGRGIPIVVPLSGNLPPIVDSTGKPVYGYTYASGVAGLQGDILPRPVTVTGLSVDSKVYDGTTAATITSASLAGLVGTQSLKLDTSGLAFDSKDVGVGRSVTGTVGLADGANGGLARNYVLSSSGAVSGTADITPRPVTVANVGFKDKVYDGTTVAELQPGALQGLVVGETLTLSAANARFDTRDAGQGKTVTATVALADGTGLASNYRLSGGGQATGQASILPRPLQASGFTAADKVYDGTRDANVSGGTLANLVGDETLSMTATGRFDTADAGTAKRVDVTAVLVDGGNGGRASNYVIDPAVPLTATAAVLPRPLTADGLTVATRPYDGTRDATLAPGAQFGGMVAGESLGVRLDGGRFDTPNAGSGKTVTGTLVLTDGAQGKASNYRLDSAAVTLSGTIVPRALTFVSVRADDKVYDGSTAATVAVAGLQGLVGSETLQVQAVGRFADADAGSGKTVLVEAVLGNGTQGGLAANYTVPAGSATATASITPRPLRVSGVRVLDKAYDGTTAAFIEATGFDGIVAGQALGLSTAARFDNANAGAGRAVSGSFTLADAPGGNGRAANYALVDGGSFAGSATITPRGLAVTAAVAADKVYDGGTAASVSGFVLSGLIGSDVVTVSAGTGRFADADVGTGKSVTATATGLGGAAAANYALAQPSVTVRASITPATLRYEADAVAGEVTMPLPALTGRVTGFVGSDTQATATSGSLRFDTSATPASPVGRYAVTGSGLVARNYRFEQAPGNATALSLVTLSTTTIATSTSNLPTVTRTLTQVLPPPASTSPSAGRALDVTSALALATSGASAPSFRTLDLGSRTRDEVAGLLAARDQYKKGIFADAIRELERNPAAADAPVCQTVEQAAAGQCLITEVLKPALRERVLREQPALAAAPAAVPPPAAAAPPVVAPAPAPAAMPAVVPSVAVAPAAPAAPATLARARDAELRLPAPRQVRSASLPQIQRKWALLIGTDLYDDSRIPRLDNAVADVDAVARVLEDRLGYQTVVVRNGSKAALLRAFNQLAAVVSPADSVAIYYAGHGELIEKTGLGYWQPADADAARPESWLSNTDIGKLLGQLGASQVVLVSDSCFSGSLVGDDRIRAGGSAPDAAALLSRRAAVVMSSGGNEPVFDSGKNGHSTFAWSFMRAVEGVSSWRPGSNVFEQVRFAVARQVPQKPQYGASRLGGHQPGADYVFEQRQLESGAK